MASSGSAGSLGWVGFAFFEENIDKLRAFDISEEAGGTCVTPDAETIASNEYPIARDLFIYVNKAKAAANPAVVAYVDFYLADGTIDSVLETVPYVPLGDALAESQSGLDDRQGRRRRRPERHDLRDWLVHGRADLAASRRRSRPPMPASTTRSKGPAPVTASPSSAPVRQTSPMRPARSAKKRSPPAPRAAIEYVELKVAIDGIAVITQK